MRSRISFVVAILALSGCSGSGGSGDGDTSTGADADGDSDSDTDGDTDSDSDTDTDGDGDADSDSDADSDAGADGGSDTDDCTYRMAIVTDIDATLTTADAEWLKQIAVSSYDPAMRPDADVLMQDYAALGYEVFYITARGEGLSLLDGTSARDATEQWLVDHGFPFEDTESLFLADGVGAWGNSAADYKTTILEGLMDAGWRFIYAYGNAETDIEAFLAVGIADTDVFLVGDLAGTLGVSGVTNDDAYAQHIVDHMPSVPEATCADE
jgi:hypothetical protein